MYSRGSAYVRPLPQDEPLKDCRTYFSETHLVFPPSYHMPASRIVFNSRKRYDIVAQPWGSNPFRRGSFQNLLKELTVAMPGMASSSTPQPERSSRPPRGAPSLRWYRTSSTGRKVSSASFRLWQKRALFTPSMSKTCTFVFKTLEKVERVSAAGWRLTASTVLLSRPS